MKTHLTLLFLVVGEGGKEGGAGECSLIKTWKRGTNKTFASLLMVAFRLEYYMDK